VGVLHEIAVALIRERHKPITAKCLIVRLMARTERPEVPLDKRVHFP